MLLPESNKIKPSPISQSTLLKFRLSRPLEIGKNRMGKIGVAHIQKVRSKKKFHRTSFKKYSESEPRDFHGRWTAGGGGGEASRVVFEVAPNPDNSIAMDRWNKLSAEEKSARSKEVAKEYVPKILAEQGVHGELKEQIGSFQDDTNASFSLNLAEGTNPDQIVDATKALGYNLSQKSMMTISDKPFPNSQEMDAIHIVSNSKDFTFNSAQDLYNSLREIKAGTDSAVGGQTTVGSHMVILNPDAYKVMDTGALTAAIKEKLDKLPDDYTIYTSKINAWFAEEGTDYGGHKNNQPATGATTPGQSIQTASSGFRDAITQAVTKILHRFFKERFTKKFREEVIYKVVTISPKVPPAVVKKSLPLKSPWSVRMILKSNRPNRKFAVTVNKVKAHPIKQKFLDLHRSYEPRISDAFIKACEKIKKQIDMKELTDAVEGKNIHRIVSLVVGNHFEKQLGGEFKNLLFEAYHAGALIGASQVKNKPVRKGGPGSGRHPGFGTAESGQNTYRRILAGQREKEGMRPALRHDMTGEVFPAQSHEAEHQEILDRIGGDFRDYEQGFVTRHGHFVSRDSTERSFGRMLAIKAISASLDVTNPSAVDYLAEHLPELIKEINEEQARIVQKILLDGINNGEEGPDIARDIRQVVGLTETQASWVENFRNQLETGVNGDYTPVEDRRLNAVDSRTAQDEFDSPNTDQDTVDYLVDKYTASLVAKRGMDIAVSEIHRASMEGQQNIWEQASDLGYLDSTITRRHWLGVHDDKERDDHWAVEDMNEPDGVGIDEPFQTPWGEAMYPGDGPDEEAINCRCVTFLTFNDEFGTGSGNNVPEGEGGEDAQANEE